MGTTRTTTFQLECTTHDLKTIREKTADGEIHERKVLMVTLKGSGAESKTKVVFQIDPLAKDEFPIGAVAEASLDIRQQQLGLTTVPETPGPRGGKGASKPSRHKGAPSGPAVWPPDDVVGH